MKFRSKKKMLGLAALLAVSLAGTAPQANAMPTGGQAVNGGVYLMDKNYSAPDGHGWFDSGTGAMNIQDGDIMQVQKTYDGSPALLIKWQSFDIEAGNSFTIDTAAFNVPVVNLVSSETATTIAGTLTEKGAAGAYIVNTNGINIASTAHLDVANLTLSTASASDDEWKNPTAVLATKAANGGISMENGASIQAYQNFATQSLTLDVAEGVSFTLQPDGNNNYVADATGAYVPETPGWTSSSVNLTAAGNVRFAGTMAGIPVDGATSISRTASYSITGAKVDTTGATLPDSIVITQTEVVQPEPTPPEPTPVSPVNKAGLRELPHSVQQAMAAVPEEQQETATKAATEAVPLMTSKANDSTAVAAGQPAGTPGTVADTATVTVKESPASQPALPGSVEVADGVSFSKI